MKPALSIVVALFVSSAASAYEEAPYEVVREEEDFEIRRYAPYLVAETAVDGALWDSGGTAFRKLFRYITGANRSAQRLPGAADDRRIVSQEAAGGKKIAMTIPVFTKPANAAAEGDTAEPGLVYQFVMPAAYDLDTLPVPEDPSIVLREEPARWVAVHRFSGLWSERRIRAAEDTLRAGLMRAGIAPRGPVELARYDDPFTLWFLRRNEVLLEIDP
ncbi:MAG: heme-binding protein [Myxococcota bacterium]